MIDPEEVTTAELVANMLGLFDALGDVLPRGQTAPADGDKIQASKGTSVPAPISIEVFDLRTKMVAVAERYMRLIESYRDLNTVATHPRRGRYADQRPRLIAALDRLEAHAEWAEQQKWGKDIHPQLYRLHSKARLLIGLDSPIIRIAELPCPQCDTKALIRHHGWSHVKCAKCKTIIDEQTYRLTIRAALSTQASAS